MCRICGRVVKCIFDSMPSRVYTVPSRRAFTTIRRVAAPSSAFSTASYSSQPISQLARPFSGLSVRPIASTLASTLVRPSISSTSATTQVQSTIAGQLRNFSASATLGAKRDTYRPSRLVQKRRHGFLTRIRSKGGIATIKRRRLKGRSSVSW